MLVGMFDIFGISWGGTFFVMAHTIPVEHRNVIAIKSLKKVL